MQVEPIVTFIEEQTQSRVYSGPFKNMTLSPNVPWPQYDRPSKLLGTYEEELHPYIVDMIAKNYDCVVDIGHAEGYYAVGLSLLFKNALVYAYDNNLDSKKVCLENAVNNGVEDRLRLRDFCDSQELMRTVLAFERPFILCDCEGYEIELFENPNTVRHLASSDLIVECHDFLIAHATDIIKGRFAGTHNVDVIHAAGRNPNRFSFLKASSDLDRWRAVCENRPAVMSWVICKARAAD